MTKSPSKIPNNIRASQRKEPCQIKSTFFKKSANSNVCYAPTLSNLRKLGCTKPFRGLTTSLVHHSRYHTIISIKMAEEQNGSAAWPVADAALSKYSSLHCTRSCLTSYSSGNPGHRSASLSLQTIEEGCERSNQNFEPWYQRDHNSCC